jgi:hypothetical protein
MDRLSTTVREQVALGRLLPLGSAGDPLWITESAVARVLRRAAAWPGLRLGPVRILLDETGVAGAGAPAGGPAPDAAPAPGPLPVAGTAADGALARGGEPGGAGSPVEGGVGPHGGAPAGGAAPGPTGAEVLDAAPLGALAHGPLRIEAGFETTMDEPLPVVAERLREALWARARDAFGATVTAVDLRVTGILEDAAEAGHDAAEVPAAAGPAPGDGGLPAAVPNGPAEAVAVAVRAVPGVAAITARLAGMGSGVRVADPEARPGSRRVQVQIAVAPGHHPVAVARAVALAATAAASGAPDPVSTAVVVTDVY